MEDTGSPQSAGIRTEKKRTKSEVQSTKNPVTCGFCSKVSRFPMTHYLFFFK